MRRILTVVLAAAAAVAGPAFAADCNVQAQSKMLDALKNAPPDVGITSGAKALLASRRYFEDPEQGAECSQPELDHPLYPGIPVKECTYQRLGLNGWVMVANPSAEVLSKWIFNACSETADAKVCAVRLTAQAWCTSEFVFPVAGNWIAPDSAQPTKAGVNTAFLHGVPIARPDWLTEKTPVTADIQKQRLYALAAREDVYSGLAGRASWPLGITPEAYAKNSKGLAKSGASLVSSCAVLARRTDWLNASRVSYNEAWRTGRNPMFDAAAKALMAGEQISGPSC